MTIYRLYCQHEQALWLYKLKSRGRNYNETGLFERYLHFLSICFDTLQPFLLLLLLHASASLHACINTQLSFSQDDIYMFGGKLEAGWANVTDELWVFNIPSRTWQRRNPVIGPPAQIYAVEGHSAHCVSLDEGEAIMLVIFGYSPIYSYISNVQEYSLSESQLKETACFSFFELSIFYILSLSHDIFDI